MERERVRLCYTDTDSFILYIKTEDFYEDIVDDVEEWFDTSNYTVDRPLPIGKNKIRGKKLQYDINREAAKISALSSGKIGKYGYFTDEEILPSNQDYECIKKILQKSRMIKSCNQMKLIMKYQNKYIYLKRKTTN